ncbi:hypothetical protein NDU88_002546 [Pleurodeles waltl]|uniref:Uncharacterized protein n=1 Tax=Pleurodeles waltl TaxID=8319 RepID=A0AAV7VZM7_PLEWA|nr:hypothetical protein NDU88_002546 [Pleurodeles waltl]
MFDNFSVAHLSHNGTSGPRKNYQTFTGPRRLNGGLEPFQPENRGAWYTVTAGLDSFQPVPGLLASQRILRSHWAEKSITGGLDRRYGGGVRDRAERLPTVRRRHVLHGDGTGSDTLPEV